MAEKVNCDVEEGIAWLRKEVVHLQAVNLKELTEKVEKYFIVKADIDIKEVRESVFMLNEELDSLNKKFSREKHVFSTGNVGLMQERHE